MSSASAILIVSTTLLVSCSGSYQGSSDSAKNDARLSRSHTTISPGRCRIVGTIVSVSDDRAADPKSPCAVNPCVATVRIDSVLGYGSGFSRPLAMGQEVGMTFSFTLGPTTPDLFPNMQQRYPGLEAGSTFRADIASVSDVGDASSTASYAVDAYMKIR